MFDVGLEDGQRSLRRVNGEARIGMIKMKQPFIGSYQWGDMQFIGEVLELIVSECRK